MIRQIIDGVDKTNVEIIAINDLSDVTITGTPSDNELLAFDFGSGEWINQTTAEAGLDGLFLLKTGGTMTGDLQITSATSPFIMLTDTTNTVSVRLTSLDSSAVIGTTTNHDFLFIVGNSTVMILDFSEDSLLIQNAGKIQFGDTGTFIHQSVDGQLDFVGDIEIEITAPTVDINASSGIDLAGADLVSSWTISSTNKLIFGTTGNFIHANATDEITLEAAVKLTLGVLGDVIMGGSTETDWFPSTDKKVNLGKSSNKINNIFCHSIDAGDGGVINILSTNNVANPPTDTEIDTALGNPATVGAGFTGIIDDNGADTNVFICVSTGTAWFTYTGTKAV